MYPKNYKPSEWQVNQDNIAALHARINRLEAEVAALKEAAMTPEQIAQRAEERAENDAFCETLRCNK
jgi:outer membrane murein-binding lipoprotein Lpp